MRRPSFLDALRHKTNRRIRQTAAVFAAVALCGCATPQQRLMQDVASYRAACQAAGFDLDADAGRQCVMQLWQQAEASRTNRATAMLQLGQSMMAIDAQQRAARPVTCTSFQNGRWISTTCQ